MSLVQDDAAGQRLWQGLGGLIFGGQDGQPVDVIVTNRGGQISLDARPVAQAAPVVATVGGFQVTWPMVLIGGAVAYLLLRR